MSYILFFPYQSPYWLLILCLWPQTQVQERKSLSPLSEVPLMAQGLFFLLCLGGSQDGLHPLQGRRCLSEFLGSALCSLWRVKPNTSKMEHFLYETLYSPSPWYYSINTSCFWMNPILAIANSPFLMKVLLWVAWFHFYGDFIYCLFSISRPRGGMCSPICILSHCCFWVCTVRCIAVTGTGCLVNE